MIILAYSFRSLPVYYNHFRKGSGFTSSKFTESPTIKYVKDHLKGKTLYTNDIFLLKIFTNNRRLIYLPSKNKTSALNEIKPKLNTGEGVIIYLDLVNWRNYVVNKKVVLESFNHSKIIKFEDGIIITDN